MMALADLLGATEGRAAEAPNCCWLRGSRTFRAKAKNVIFMFMEGGPSQMDLFDPKPELQKWHGKPLPESMTKDLKLAFIKPTAAVLASPREFKQYGQCGMEFSDYLPHIAHLRRRHLPGALDAHATRSIIIPGSCCCSRDHMQFGRPTMGAWALYGLGSESQNLPGFVVLASGVGTSGGASNFSSGFLPSTYQGTLFRSSGDPILYLSNPQGVSQRAAARGLDAMRDLNQEHWRTRATRRSRRASPPTSWRSACRRRARSCSISRRNRRRRWRCTASTRSDEAFGTNCLLARRMVERGVRFVMLMHASWDQHTDLNRRPEEELRHHRSARRRR